MKFVEPRYGDHLTEEELERVKAYAERIITNEYTPYWWDSPPDSEKIWVMGPDSADKIKDALQKNESPTFRCKKCGWEGKDIEKWEEWPRDEFTVKCPHCHAIDENIEVRDEKGVWMPAVKRYVPTPEEKEMMDRFYENVAKLLIRSNVYREVVYKREG